MVWVAVLAAVHLVAGWFIVTRSFRPGRLCDLPLEWLLVSFATFYGFPVIIGSVTGLLSTGTVVASALIAAGLSGLSVFFGGNARGYGRELLGWLKTQSVVSWLLMMMLGVLLFALLALGLGLPVRAWDAYGYHILGPMRWVQSGRFQLEGFGDTNIIPDLAPSEVYPNIKGILPYLIMLWSGSSTGTAIAQWPFLVLLGAGVGSLFCRLGIKLPFVLLGVVFCISAPEALLQGVECYSDMVYFGALMAVMAVIVRIWQDGSNWQAIVLSSLAFAQLAGSKPSSLIPCGILGFGLLVAIVMNYADRKGLWRKRLGQAGLGFATVITVALAMSGVWYWHGYKKFHNPVYPIEAKVGGKVIFEGPYPQTNNTDFAARQTGRSGWDGWWGVMTDGWRSPSISSWGSGMGAAAFVVGLPAVLILLLFAPLFAKKRGVVLTMVIFGFLIVANSAPTLSRFLLFTLAFGALAFGLIANVLQLWSRVLLGLTVLGVCFYNLYITFPSVLYRARPAELVMMDLVSGNSRAAKTDTYPDEYSPLDYWLDFVSGSNRRLAITDETFLWQVYDPGTNPPIVRVPVGERADLDDWIGRAVEMKATHGIFPRSSPLYEAAIQSQKLRVLYTGGYARVVRGAFQELPYAGGVFEIVQ